MISDTTIAAAEGCGSEMRDKFRMNFFIAFPAAVLSLIFYGFIGGAGSGSIEVGAFDLFQIAPYIVVLVTALMGINVAVVLFIGILMTFIVGLLQGNVGFFDIAMAVGDGMADMFSISIVAILVSGVIGLVRYYGGIEWMIDTITKKIKNKNRQNMVSVSFPVFYPVLWSIIRLLSSLPVLLQKRSAASTRSRQSVWQAW